MKLRVVGVLAGLALVLTGCQATPTTSDSVSVVVGLYPYAYLAESIGGEHVTVTNLTTPGAEPHDLELTARQVATLITADLVIFQSGFQPAVDSAVQESPAGRVLDVTSVISLEAHDENSDDHGEHNHGTLDPHVWLDPTKMMVVAQEIATQLIQIDPVNEGTYVLRLTKLKERLQNLDEDFIDGLSTCELRVFLTTHAAFGYLAERYNLTQVAISGLSPDADPSPVRIAEIHEIAEEHTLTTVFFETLASPALAQTIATDLGLKTDQLDPLEGITSESRGDDYPTIMASNLSALRLANTCS
ncbi:MAG: metal ABC transporter substrate-binding protein [Propionibacteriaceae bacterium]|nr:metal ABC transporter substrate-binding protein [Propionibacteriaceae bacterium]